jgi:hypothetical protein
MATAPAIAKIPATTIVNEPQDNIQPVPMKSDAAKKANMPEATATNRGASLLFV